MDIGTVRKIDIDHEMQQSYLDYAMSVIVSRALPDARDGLKPVQRRILYAMYDMGLRADSSYKKSARIVGEVLGKYHPHGDSAVYESMARLAQDFSMRAMLVDGQGNFGSVDGDPPAAMRYTEARLTNFSMAILNQLDRNTVDYIKNFDESLTEPTVLPAAVPNLLVNGASGIAVGMATNIPPHNLGEVVDAASYLIKEWDRVDDVSVSDLMKFIKGPDFPTGGVILQEQDTNDLLTAYATGKGKIIVRGQVHIEDMGRGKNRLIISELPYQTNKSSLIERIADLVRDNNLEGISDLRDESDRQGMRIVIELSKTADPEKVIRELFKRTPLQTTFGINLLALVGGEPRMLTLKQALKVYILHRIEVVRRRTEFDLEKAKSRIHILEGLRIALKNLDEIIALIKSSPDTDIARFKLMNKFKLSVLQAQAILDMALKRLAALERKKIEDEYKELVAFIKEMELILKSPKKMRELVNTELQGMKTSFADKRRTQIVTIKAGKTVSQLLTTTDLTPDTSAWVGLTNDGYLGRISKDELPRLSGKDAPKILIKTSAHQSIFLVASDGKAAVVAVHSLPEVEKFSDGNPFYKLTPLQEGSSVVAGFAVDSRASKENLFVVTVSRTGLVKKTDLAELPGPSSQPVVIAKVNPRDEIGWAFISTGNDDFLVVTSDGMGIRFSESEVRTTGLIAAGVNGIKLGAKEEVVFSSPVA
ncbi:MAG: DNA topoisomerase 4 subunit A, partial [Anaerolineaceae bacterium]|nr:DNA topoisomerase 4 subunit A [Anaerolineaceae bacterium]